MTDNEIPPAGCGIVRQHRAHRYFEGETPISRPCSGEGVDLDPTHSTVLETQRRGRVQRAPQDRSADGVPEVAQEPRPAPTLADGVAELRDALKPLEEIAPGYHYALVPILDRIAGAVPQRATDLDVVRAARRWYREHGYTPGYLPRNVLSSDRDLKAAVEALGGE